MGGSALDVLKSFATIGIGISMMSNGNDETGDDGKKFKDATISIISHVGRIHYASTAIYNENEGIIRITSNKINIKSISYININGAITEQSLLYEQDPRSIFCFKDEECTININGNTIIITLTSDCKNMLRSYNIEDLYVDVYFTLSK